MPPPGEPPFAGSRGLIIAVVLLIFTIIAAGVLFYQSQEQQIKYQVASDLTAIAKLKSDQIVTWRADRIYDARIITSGGFFSEGSDHFMTYGDDESRKKILLRFEEMDASPHYDNALLVDPQGKVHLSLDPSVTSIPPSIITQVNASLKSGDVVLTDLYQIPGTHTLRMDVIAPLILTTDSSKKAVGAVLLSIDPDEFLYPFIQSWPVPSRSAETLLVEREGDHILFLNELRHQNNTALNLTVPISRTDTPAVMAVLGKTGVVTGRDYRGTDVISVLEPIPGSPWFMVTKIDLEEAYSSWQSRAVLIIVLIAGSLTGVFIITGLVWQRRRKYYYLSLYAAQKEAETEIQNSRNFLNSIIEQSPNPIWISDAKGTLIRLNRACYEMLHLTPEEVVGRYNVLEDSIVESQGKMPLVRSVFEEGRSVNFDLEYDSKLLTSLALDQSAKVFLNVTIFPVRDTSGRITNAVIQHLDFTERKRVEAELAAVHQKYRDLFENVSIGILRSTPGPQGTLIEANPATLRIFEADSREQFLAVHPSDLYFDSDQRSRVSDEILAKGTIKGMEVRYKTLKGNLIWARISSTKKFATDGQIFFDNTIEDITERKRVDEALRETNEYLRNLLDYANAPIIVWNTGFRITRFNPAFELLTGRTVLEVIGAHLSILFPERSRVSSLEQIQKALTGERLEVVEIPILHVSGEIRIVLWNSANVTNEDGKVVATIAQGVDITERKKTEDALRESEKKFRDMVINLNEGFYSCTIDGVVLEHNPAFNRILGFEPDMDMRGALLPDFWQDAGAQQEYINELIGKGIVRNYIIQAKKPDNEKIVITANSHVVYNVNGTLVRIEGTFLDITEQKHAEELIKTSETRYRRLFESARDGILIINKDTGEIIDANPYIETLLGYNPQEIIGKYLWEIGPFMDRLLSKIAFAELQDKKYQMHEDLPLETKQGQRIDAEFVSYIYPVENTSVIQCNIRDITDRKIIEQQREALIQELGQKNAELERFTYTVSHDLKSPLITIRGFATLLEDDALTGDPILLKKDIHRIIEAADTMQALLTDVLELSRIGRVIKPPETISFGSIAHEAVNLLTVSIARQGVTIEIAPDLPEVSVDHARILEVMVNLIENSLKFLGDQPAPTIRIGVEMKGKIPVFFVQDNGIGIDPRYLERIFNLFERLDASSPGTGVGLTIVRRIIELHGGRIWAESDGVGKGTTFRFTLTGPEKEEF